MAFDWQQPHDLLIKVLTIGDSGVGKSCLLTRFTDDAFTTEHIFTIGIDFKVRMIDMDGKRIKLQIWDTAGQERFRTITTAYYRGAHGILLVYDVTDEQSFQSIRNWVRNVDEHSPVGVNKLLVGNKSDLPRKRVVSKERGEALAKEYDLPFFETSAKNNINVYEAFLALTQAIKKRIVDDPIAAGRPPAGTLNLGESSGAAEGEKKKSCCSGGK